GGQAGRDHAARCSRRPSLPLSYDRRVIEPLAVPAGAPEADPGAPEPAPDQAPLRVARLGLGTVALPVAAHRVDPEWRSHVAERGTTPPELVAVGVRDPERPRGVELPDSVRRTDDLASLAADPDIDVVVELIGGT